VSLAGVTICTALNLAIVAVHSNCHEPRRCKQSLKVGTAEAIFAGSRHRILGYRRHCVSPLFIERHRQNRASSWSSRAGFPAGGRGKAGKNLAPLGAWQHPAMKCQAMEVSRRDSGVSAPVKSGVPSSYAKQCLQRGKIRLIPFGRVPSTAQLGRCLSSERKHSEQKAAATQTAT
jgi:hypothetical protein